MPLRYADISSEEKALRSHTGLGRVEFEALEPGSSVRNGSNTCAASPERASLVSGKAKGAGTAF